MDEALRHEIGQRHQAGASLRSIAKDLGISRGAVGRALARVQAQRDGRSAPLPGLGEGWESALPGPAPAPAPPTGAAPLPMPAGLAPS